MFPYTNIDMNPSVYVAFSCERLSMVMSLPPLSHICLDSWHQEVLIVLICAYWPRDILSLLATDMVCLLSCEVLLRVSCPVFNAHQRKRNMLACSPFSGPSVLVFFVQVSQPMLLLIVSHGGMPKKKAPPKPSHSL